MSAKAHVHRHSPDCGHTAVEHEGHVDYLQDGHLIHQEDGSVEEHTIAVTKLNPDGCHPIDAKTGHDVKTQAWSRPWPLSDRTAIILIIWSMGDCIIRMARIAMTTVRSKSRRKVWLRRLRSRVDIQ